MTKDKTLSDLACELDPESELGKMVRLYLGDTTGLTAEEIERFSKLPVPVIPFIQL